jgi:riboflavin synthase
MFTGLVEAVGELVARQPGDGGFRLRIACPIASELAPGDSLAVNGVCLTVTGRTDGDVSADIGPETVRVTTLGSLAPGAPLNLERPLRADGRLGGHFVQGHVDGLGTIEEVRADADFHWLTVGFPPQLAPYFVEKGSIAVDGISLTIAALGVENDRFGIMVIPYTMQHTNLGRARAGDRVNLECDLVGKYVLRAASLAGIDVLGARSREVAQ